MTPTPIPSSAPLPILLRRRCCYCAVPHPHDGLGLILSGQDVSDGFCDGAFHKMMTELDASDLAVEKLR